MKDEPMKIPVQFNEASELLKQYLKLSGSPVALKFATTKDEIPEGIPEIEKTIRHCAMVNLARKEGRIFYATSSKHECNGGAWALGLREITQTLKTGEFYFRLGKFASAPACKRTMGSIPHLESGYTYATVYSPLEKVPFTPHIILILANPWAMLKLAQASLFRIGGRLHPEFSGIQSVCSDATTQTFLTGRPNFSLGCDGSRKFSGVADEEMVMGMPAELLPEIVDALKIIIGAPGSKK